LISSALEHFSNEPLGDLGLRLRTKAAAYGLGGLVLAGAVIFSGSAMGLLGINSSGILSVLLTDPPNVPTGVSAVYVTYSGIAVHASGFNDSGWIPFSGQGTIDTLKLINLSRTISTGVVPSFTYDLVELNISKVQVEYMGANYSVTVASGMLVAPIVGGVRVSSSSPSAALIDIQPTVLDLGTQTSPGFTMATGARGLQVPSDEVSDSMRYVGSSYSLQGRGWYETFRHNQHDNLTISGLVLSSNSLAFSVTNAGSDLATIRMVILTPVSSGGGSGMPMGSLANSIFLAVQSDGSLKLANGTPIQVGSFLESRGFSLAPGVQHTFGFTGAITSLFGKHGVLSGTTYSVVLMGEDAYRATIVAS